MEQITVNILGETQKEQWLNAIMIYEECICANMRTVYDFLEDEADGRELDCFGVAMRTTKDFADEMRRLVEGVFNDD